MEKVRIILLTLLMASLCSADMLSLDVQKNTIKSSMVLVSSTVISRDFATALNTRIDTGYYDIDTLLEKLQKDDSITLTIGSKTIKYKCEGRGVVSTEK